MSLPARLALAALRAVLAETEREPALAVEVLRAMFAPGPQAAPAGRVEAQPAAATSSPPTVRVEAAPTAAASPTAPAVAPPGQAQRRRPRRPKPPARGTGAKGATLAARLAAQLHERHGSVRAAAAAAGCSVATLARWRRGEAPPEAVERLRAAVAAEEGPGADEDEEPASAAEAPGEPEEREPETGPEEPAEEPPFRWGARTGRGSGAA